MCSTLYYIHDPMCSWCWGFRPTWHRLRQQLPHTLTVRPILAGLAPDSDKPMPLETQTYIKNHWTRIQRIIPGTIFNNDFWVHCTPRRSTYPACRAVIAAKKQNSEHEMIEAIQQAYYVEAKNPSDVPVLVKLADDIRHYQQLSLTANISGLPSLVLENQQGVFAISIDYHDEKPMLRAILK